MESNKVIINFIDEDLLIKAKKGLQLTKIIDESGADITLGCRKGTCGTCRINVIEGNENLSDLLSEEKDFLSGLNATDNQRLACQVIVNGDCTLQAYKK